MRKSTIGYFGAVASLLMSLQASAVVINGTNYKLFSNSGSICPDGSKVFVYNGSTYCKAYHANVKWAIPVTRTNGTPLYASDLSGYEVYWTRAKDGYKGVITVSGGTNVATSLDAYTPDTYYFAVSAIDTKGLKSPLSTVASIVLK